MLYTLDRLCIKTQNKKRDFTAIPHTDLNTITTYALPPSGDVPGSPVYLPPLPSSLSSLMSTGTEVGGIRPVSVATALMFSIGVRS